MEVFDFQSARLLIYSVHSDFSFLLRGIVPRQKTTQSEIVSMINFRLLTDAGFVYNMTYQVTDVGVHPDNREKMGLVIADVHDLLVILVRTGWNAAKVNALGCELPPGKVGDDWREFNRTLWAESGGYLAVTNSGELKNCTARGSHTTACVRLLKHGGKSMHEEIAEKGRISLGRILDKQPGIRIPIDGGLMYLCNRMDNS